MEGTSFRRDGESGADVGEAGDGDVGVGGRGGAGRALVPSGARKWPSVGKAYFAASASAR